MELMFFEVREAWSEAIWATGQTKWTWEMGIGACDDFGKQDREHQWAFMIHGQFPQTEAWCRHSRIANKHEIKIKCDLL